MMRTSLVMTTLFARLLFSCSPNPSEPELSEYTVQIKNEGSGQILVNRIFELTENGTKYCFEDAELSKAYEDVLLAHESKDVIQIPLPGGDVIDSVIKKPATPALFGVVNFTGQFNGDQLIEITKVCLLYHLIVEGMDLGWLASTYVSPAVLNDAKDFKKLLNDAIQSQSAELLTAEELEQRRNAGNMGEPLPTE